MLAPGFPRIAPWFDWSEECAMERTLALLAAETITPPLPAAASRVAPAVPDVGSADVNPARRTVTVTFEDPTNGIEPFGRACRQADRPSSVVEDVR